MTIEERLEKCIESCWNQKNESYAMYIDSDKVDEAGFPEEIEIPTVLEEIIGDKGKVWHSGGFDSPGYSLKIYSYAFINERKELKVGSIEFETY